MTRRYRVVWLVALVVVVVMAAGYGMTDALAEPVPTLPALLSVSLLNYGAPPVPVITKAPGRLSYFTSADFEFTDEVQHSRFQCQLDSAPFAPCGPGGISYNRLALGRHCFQVLAVYGKFHSGSRSFCWQSVPVVLRGEFTIGGNPAHLFYPGTSQAIDLIITNPFRFAIKVSSISVSVASDPTKGGRLVIGCPASENMVVARPFSGSVVVAGRTSEPLSNLGVPQARWPVLTMPDLTTNQDACKGARFELLYQGRATEQ